MTAIDPFTIEIIKESLIAVGDEMFIAMQRTSMSPVIYEVLDYATGLMDADGNLITQGDGVAGFISMLSFAAQDILKKYAGRIHEGDVFMTNDPYIGGGSHPSDVTLVMPIFYQEVLVGFAANKAHWTEVGGMAPGSWTTNSTDVWQEGLQFPCIKLCSAGKINDPVVEMIRANVRTPDMSIGDLQAQLASVRIARQRMIDLCERYGLETIQAGIDALLDYGEAMTRRELNSIPNGNYSASGLIDDDGLGNGPFEVTVSITKTDDQFICDFTGTYEQVPGPINCGRNGLEAAVRVVFKALTSPSIPANDGCFRMLDIICPDGTVVTAHRPAPVSIYWESMDFAADMIWKAMAPILPGRLTMGHYMSVCGTIIAGTHPDSDELFILVEPQAGGWGAGADRDGENGLVCIGDGETYNTPVEIAETRYGVLVQQYTFDVCDGGAGQFRGGRGLIRDYEMLCDDAMVTGTYGRHKYPAWGSNGGANGSPNYMAMLHQDGCEVRAGKFANYRLERGEVARMGTGTGGGYGNPSERAPKAIQQDLRDGYITAEMAQRDYGFDAAE